MNVTHAALQPVQATIRQPGRPATPAVIQAIEVSGWAYTPNGPMPFHRARLNPAHTQLNGWCNCPMNWQTLA